MRDPIVSSDRGHSHFRWAISNLMELYQLGTFIAVAEAQNLTHAADGLHTSEPAVSKR